MSATSENSQDSSKSASAEVQDASRPTGPSPSIGTGKVPEKTISCVSCRRRKLKCDRVKPKCGTCTRLRHECEFPERRRNLGTKRRNIKELEARLIEVETQLLSESKQAAPTAVPNETTDWNMGMDLNLDMNDDGLLDHSFDMTNNGFGFQAPIALDDFGSYDLIGLGLQEPLPARDVMDELHQIYFEKYHPTMPMMHKPRYYASLDRAPHMRPPISLRYAMWTMAASLSDKYSCLESVFYERARRYIQEAEMKGHGETFVSVYYVQAWSLIATYEASKTLFSRAWMSVGRAVRLAQMTGLHRLDGDDPSMKNILPPPSDWIEREERRRTFWAVFYNDRWASSGTGWPMIIVESDILTDLPASEKSFKDGIEEATVSLQEASTAEGAPLISSFAGVVIAAALFGRNYQHLHAKGPTEKPEDLANGDFWKRHRKMDNVLSNTFMFLPDHLRLPGNIRDMNVVFIHMNIHTSCICLHQAAVLMAKKHNIDPNFIQQSRNRNIMAAEEITNIMRMVSHLDAATMNSWIGFCLYVAAGIFIHDIKSGMLVFDPVSSQAMELANTYGLLESTTLQLASLGLKKAILIRSLAEHRRPQSVSNLEFLLLAMRAIGLKHAITNHFTAQLELDMNAAGIRDPVSYPACPVHFDGSSYASTMNAVRQNIITVQNHNIATFAQESSNNLTFTDIIEDVTLSNVAACFHAANDPSLQTMKFMHPSVPYLVNNSRLYQESDADPPAATAPSTSDTRNNSTSISISEANPFTIVSDPFATFDFQRSTPSGNTPNSDSSSSYNIQGGGSSNTTNSGPGSTTTQYPFRHVNPKNHSAKPHGIVQREFMDTSSWATTGGLNDTGQGNGLQDTFDLDNAVQKGGLQEAFDPFDQVHPSWRGES